MTLFNGGLTRLRSRARGSEPRPLVTFPNFLRRHWITSLLIAVVLLIGFGYLTWWSQSQKCGRGMTPTGSPYACVGLDLDSTAFRDADSLADLEHTIADNNRAISEPFATIVVLQDWTTDPKSESVTLREQRHDIEGVITAVSRANDPKASGAIPKIKLLLANYNLGASAWPQAVDAIKRARLSEHIVAVTGIDQSLDTTRAAVASLSDAGIAVVSADATADNMNVAPSPGGKRSANFFRVAPTNTEEARVAAKYIEQHGYHKVLLVKDVNEGDSYAQTLANAFAINVKVDNTEPYRSQDKPLSVATREQFMVKIFADMHSDICAIRPDLIYFAGRGVDLGYFLTALSSSGACGLGPLDVMAGDDADSLVGGRISTSGNLSFTVFYTAFAHVDEWSGFPPDSDYVKNYQDFVAAFTEQRFTDANLDDGEAMLSYDAVRVAISATKADPLAATEPDSVTAFLIGIHCHNYVPGASGPIAFDLDGNPIDKAMPILQLHADGTVTQKDLAWPTGQPLDPNSTCY
jgi:ABC-type branched-subunit amino acid transport system substrate-binding protein